MSFQHSSTSRHVASRLLPLLLASVHFDATGGWLTPPQAFAEARRLVEVIKYSAAASPIVTQAAKQYQCVGGLGRKRRGSRRAGREGDGGRRHRGVARADGEGPGGHRPRAGHASDQHALALRSYRWQRLAAFAGAKSSRRRKPASYLSVVQRVEDWDYKFLPLPSGGAPDRSVRGEKT